ncbi:uncharacterized protein LOC106087918 [Stomoxys calcitrans]|uniref:uncharacterized protein LOC106087918 n=1 Tax=Stomoxys calcitrans TaxID=35570 RepID=UPI0027E32D21|nr:uncharacterized protein LOC106087918 [Stomoxys calcitrans]XP_013108590.2 uncharacterized protein LOC106087918 [Stomoxys calcitrans]XP_013108591.2 uncharacterized protein LOC106087918 [Stomoxys calcitrans]XP_059224006.1 uncharacterized protein LOC106087918 [Stomoxys calcitrans]
MLKHTSNAGGPANGQVRNNTSATGPARNIHLRPQQPLNISTLSAASLQTSSATTTVTPHSTNTTTINGGPRSTLLNIASLPPLPPSANTATTTTGTLQSSQPLLPPPLPLPLPLALSNGNGNTTNTTTTPVTPITNHLTPNGLSGIGNNLHTYTNQHIALAHVANGGSTVNNPAANTTNHTNNYTNYTNTTHGIHNKSKHGPGPREALTSLGLLCLVSLLLALLSLIFLLKISPNAREDALTRSSPEDFIIVYDVTLALCALSLSLNLCCLLVCAIQFLFAVKLVRSPMFDGRDNRYLEKSSTSRTCAVGGFFISIPIFLTGIILYTFNHFHSTPAIITSVLIGIGIIFCGAAMVHNVFVWQKEKTISYRSPAVHHMSLVSQMCPITPPVQFLNHPNHLNLNQSHISTLLHPTSITPVSPNHSHGSFNPLTALSSSFMVRPSTATPPTPKPLANGGCLSPMAGGGGGVPGIGAAREASGSVSPGIPATLDMSNVTSISLHELSTLV